MTRAYERTLQAIGDGGPHRWPSRRPCGLPRLLGHGRHQKKTNTVCYRGISTSSKKPTTTASAPTNFISVSHRLPSPPTHLAEKGHADAFQTFSLSWWGGNGLATRHPHSFSPLLPEKDQVCNHACAIDIRLPPGQRLHWQQAMEMRELEPYAINIWLPPRKRLHRQQAMEMKEPSGPTLATRGTTIRMIFLDNLLFLKARRQEIRCGARVGGSKTRKK